MATSLGPGATETYGQDLFESISLLLQAVTRIAIDALAPKWFKDDPAAVKKLADDIGPLAIHIVQVIPFALLDPMNAISSALSSAIGGPLATLGASLSSEYTTLLQSVFASFDATLKSNATVDPNKVQAAADAALLESGKMAVGSRVISLLFELLLPKQLNTLNWLGPTLAQFAGFDSIVALVREPQLDAAIGNLARYAANSQFLTEAPGGELGERLFARGLITAAQRDRLVAWSGRMVEFQPATQAAAYRGMQPRQFVNLLKDQTFPVDQVTDALTFAGTRPQDISWLVPALVANSTATVRQQYLSAVVRSAELGIVSPAELDSVMDSMNFSTEAKTFVQLTVADRKLEQLAELYRRSISEAYASGQLTDAQYVPALEAIGINEADANAHYAVDSIKLKGRELAAAEKAAARLSAAQTRAEMNAAIAAYRAEQLTDVALAAALVAAGVDPIVAAALVATQVSRRLGPQVLIYGLMLHRVQALQLREKVSAIEAQYKKQLITDAAAAAALVALDIPEVNRLALLADWAALKTKPTATGELLPT